MEDKYNYKMIVSYDGSSYNGWQRQGNTKATIQGTLEERLQQILQKPVEIHGSGRTDAGVHAYGQVANFYLIEPIEETKILEQLNKNLPEDIRIHLLDLVTSAFHSRLSAVSKEYLYFVDTKECPHVFTRKYKLHVPEKLDLGQMKEAASYLIGSHDFRSFTSDKRMEKSCIRTIQDIEIILDEKAEEGFSIRVHGDGFLYNMVRIMVGTLLEVGGGKIDVIEMEEILKSKNRECAGKTAPAHGLFLKAVHY